MTDKRIEKELHAAVVYIFREDRIANISLTLFFSLVSLSTFWLQSLLSRRLLFFLLIPTRSLDLFFFFSAFFFLVPVCLSFLAARHAASVRRLLLLLPGLISGACDTAA